MFTGANAAVVLLLWASCAVTYLHPSMFPRAGLLGLCFPAFLAVDIAFVVFWLVFKYKRVWLPLLGVAACWSFVRDYIPVNIPSPSPKGTLNVITYNTHNYGGNLAKEEDGSNAVINYLAGSGADIICLQEAKMSGAHKTTYINQMKDRGYSFCEGRDEVVFSRLPVIESDTLHYPNHGSSGMRALLKYGQDTILLVNYHFESDKMTPQIKAAYRQALENPENDSARQDFKPVIRLLTEAAPYRAGQADSICALIERYPQYPAIVCGDFNDTPISYTHRVLTRKLKSAFRQSGNGVGFTFQEHGFPVRIDNILYTDSVWRSFATRVETKIDYSDHYPVVTHLLKR